MAAYVKPVDTPEDRELFIRLPWHIYHNDPCWVPPLLEDMRQKLDAEKNPYWKNAQHQCWLAFREGRAVGRICAILDDNTQIPQTIGVFGFFECENDREAASLLFAAAESWLAAKGASIVRGPFNPTINEEPGFLVEGFNIRPVLMTGHTPRYYLDLAAACGYRYYNDLVARRYILNRQRSFSKECPEKLLHIAARVEKRKDVRIRRLDKRNWHNEIALACDLYNQSLAALRDFSPVPQEDFQQIAQGMKQIIDPRMALIAEVGGRPAGFALALPDVNQALQKADGKSDPISLLRVLTQMQHLERVSFKMLMILPEFQGRGIEALLIRNVARRIWRKGYKEVDMSLAGDENFKSNRFQSSLGFSTYLRYRLFEKDLIKE